MKAILARQYGTPFESLQDEMLKHGTNALPNLPKRCFIK